MKTTLYAMLFTAAASIPASYRACAAASAPGRGAGGEPTPIHRAARARFAEIRAVRIQHGRDAEASR